MIIYEKLIQEIMAVTTALPRTVLKAAWHEAWDNNSNIFLRYFYRLQVYKICVLRRNAPNRFFNH